MKEVEVIFWRASALSFGMLTFSFFMMYLFRDFIYTVHSHIFPHMTQSDFSSNLYLMYGGMKILIVVAFLTPALTLYWHRKAS